MSGRVYKIEHDDKVYIGSTRTTLEKRLAWHRNKASNPTCAHRQMYAYFNSIGWNHAAISLLREIENASDDELLWHERMMLEEYAPTCVWNVRHPIRSVEERVNYVNRMNKTYREKDPQKHIQRSKDWYKENSAYKVDKVREWRKSNRDKVNEQQRRRRMEKKIAEQSARLQPEDV
jgi:hypothetical protein